MYLAQAMITDTMDIIRTGKKGKHLNTLKNVTFIKSGTICI
jgi:hypothetical protein